MSKPICKVRGQIAPGAMCGYVIVGAVHCGFTGDCEHKSCAEMIVQKVLDDAAAGIGLAAPHSQGEKG